MTTRASKSLRRLLIAIAVAIAGMAAVSYLTGIMWGIHYRWTSHRPTESVATLGCAAFRGSLCWEFERMPKPLSDAFDASWPSWLHEFHLGTAWSVSWAQNNPFPVAWGFHYDSADFSCPLPTTAPVVLTPGARRAAVATYPMHYTEVAIPFWFLLLPPTAYAVYRVLGLPQRRRRQRYAAGQCVACAYDLRHTPERCPECGLVPGAARP